MKKACILLLALTLLLCGCREATAPVPETTPTLPETTAPATEPAAPILPELDAFRRVLEGRTTIYRTASMESIPIDKISLFFTVDELPWTVERFAVQDLDSDGVLDAVLEISGGAGYVVLHYQEDGSITGSEIWYRAMQELKADGSYRGSGSSFNRYYWKFHHAADILLAECYEQEDGTQIYRVAGETVDAEAFAAFEQIQSAKPDAIWYEDWEDFLAASQ